MLVINKFLMEENNGGEGDKGAGAGGILGDDPGASGQGGNGGTDGAGKDGNAGQGQGNPGSGDPSGGTSAKTVQIPEDWHKAIPDEVMSQSNLKSFKTVEALAKSYLHSQKMLGTDKIAIPKNAGDAEMREIFEKLGLPKEAEKYDIKPSENSPVDPEFVKNFKEAAFKTGVMPQQAQKLLNWVEEVTTAKQASALLKEQGQYARDINLIKEEWGDAYNENVARAKAALREFSGSQEDMEYIKGNFGANPAVLRLLTKIGATLAEDKIKGAGGTGVPGQYTPNDAKARIAEIKANVKGPYFDPTHGDHAEMKAEVARLYKFAYPEKKK